MVRVRCRQPWRAVLAMRWWAGDPAEVYAAEVPALGARPSWHALAACRGRAGYVSPYTAPPDAAATCAACPVRVARARSALDGIDSGKWLMGTWAGVHLGTHGGRKVARRQLADVVAEGAV